MNLGPLAAEIVPGSGSPFLSGGGAISLRAGRDVRGPGMVAATQSHQTDWWWRSGGENTQAWWSRYDLFQQGLATFGGGQISVQAGRDLVNLQAATATSGWVVPADKTTGIVASTRQFGGDSLRVQAGRDVVNGALYAGGATLDVFAGRDVRADQTLSSERDPGTQLMYQNTEIRVQARRDLDLASVRSAGLALSNSGVRNDSGEGTVIAGLDGRASLLVQSAGGSINYRNAEQVRVVGSAGDTLTEVVPGQARFAAPEGSITLKGRVAQQPTLDGSQQFQAVARHDVRLASLQVNATGGAPGIAVPDRAALVEALENGRMASADGLDSSGREPVRLAAEQGDVVVAGGISSARPVHISAGQDVRLLEGGVTVQHQASQPGADGKSAVLPLRELTQIQAGRDVLLSQTSAVGGVEVAGPGELLLLAGRHIDLGVSRGVVTVGNINNSTLLPEGAAGITLVAGYRGDASDYAQASAKGFHVLGGSGLTDRSDALYALLAGQADAAAAPGSSAAREFKALSAADQLQRLKALLGEADYNRAVAGYVQALPRTADKPELSQSQALAAFAAMPAEQQRVAVGPVLAGAFARLPQAQRNGLVAALATPQQRQALGDYVRGLAAGGISDVDAIAAFETLPVARQMVWLNQVLVQELRAAGRAAASSDGEARTAAYARGYRAIELLFPLDADGQRPKGDIRMPTSQVKTLQQADIALMAPGGGINAGEIASTGIPKKASDLGIVTVNGGDVSAVVRNDFEVNQSRVFTLKKGNVLLWSSVGNIDAGRGAKTVTGAPAPVLRLDDQGRLVFDTSGSFSGSGIAVLDADSDLDLYAPAGEINAGEAGIRSQGNAFFGAVRFVNAIDIQVGGAAAGGPPPTVTPAAVVAPGALPLAPTAAGPSTAKEEDDERRKKRARRTLLLDFLGFGTGN